MASISRSEIAESFNIAKLGELPPRYTAKPSEPADNMVVYDSQGVAVASAEKYQRIKDDEGVAIYIHDGMGFKTLHSFSGVLNTPMSWQILLLLAHLHYFTERTTSILAENLAMGNEINGYLSEINDLRDRRVSYPLPGLENIPIEALGMESAHAFDLATVEDTSQLTDDIVERYTDPNNPD